MAPGLPQRIPLHIRHPDHQFRAITMARAALLIRVAQGLDEWAERDRDEPHTTK